MLVGEAAENMLKAMALWVHFRYTPTHIDENDENVIDKEWFKFPAGTPVKEVWAWFEEEFNIGVDELTEVTSSLK